MRCVVYFNDRILSLDKALRFYFRVYNSWTFRNRALLVVKLYLPGYLFWLLYRLGIFDWLQIIALDSAALFDFSI